MTAYVAFDGTDYAECPDPQYGSYRKVEIRVRFANFELNRGALLNGIMGQFVSTTDEGFGHWFVDDQTSPAEQAYVQFEPDPGYGYYAGGTMPMAANYVDRTWARFVTEFTAFPDGDVDTELFFSADTTLDHNAVTWVSNTTVSVAYTGSAPATATGPIVIARSPHNAFGLAKFDCYRAVLLIDDVVVADFYPDRDALEAGAAVWSDPNGNSWALTGTTVTGVPSAYADLDALHTPVDGDVVQADWAVQAAANARQIWRGLAQPWQGWDVAPSFINAAGLLLTESYFHQLAYSVTAQFGIEISATTTLSAGDLTIDLPVKAAAHSMVIGTCQAYDSNTSTYYGGLIVTKAADTTVAYCTFDDYASSTVPFTWATGDTLTGHMFYEAHADGVTAGALL